MQGHLAMKAFELMDASAQAATVHSLRLEGYILVMHSDRERGWKSNGR
jgi:hypothetical protein